MNRSSNFYQIEGEQYDRVTRITGCIPKQDILINWAVKLTAEASADIDQGEYQTKAIFVDAVKALSKEKRIHNRDRGTEIHGAIEAHMTGQPIVEKFRPWVDQAEDVMNDYHLTDAARVEVVLVNTDMRYAGTCDLWEGDIILDWKTGARLYPDYLIQMWAYMNATHWVNPVTDKLTPIEIQPSLGILARLEEDDYETKTLESGTQMFNLCGDTFAHLQGVKSWLATEKEIW